MAELCSLLQHNTWGHTTAPTVARSARLGTMSLHRRYPPLPTVAQRCPLLCPCYATVVQQHEIMSRDTIFFCSKDARLPVQLQRAMAAEAEAAREARAKACCCVATPDTEHHSTYMLSFFYPFPSGYCCRGRTKSLESSQRGLGGHFRVVICPPAPLLAGTISACLAAASSPPASLERTTSEASLQNRTNEGAVHK